jgi:hypothetical protein
MSWCWLLTRKHFEWHCQNIVPSTRVLNPLRSTADVRFDGDGHTETHRTTFSSKVEREPRFLYVELETGVDVYGF